ncbi:MAG: hypothetical protein LBU98_04345, partial [Alistipes sp.]|nr:hypothetical protein [Alistipes sp.]
AACHTDAFDPVVPDTPIEVAQAKARAGVSDDEFCRYINRENIHRTIPLVNRYLGSLPAGLDTAGRAKALTTLFGSFDGIVGARLHKDEYMRTPAVFFTFMDGPTERELGLDLSSTGMVMSYWYEVTTGVYAKTERYFKIDGVFDFINSVDLKAAEISSGVCVSGNTSSEAELQRIADALFEKPYTHDGAWETGGYLQYQTGAMTLFPHLFGMNNRSYQADWLAAMREYNLTETFDYDHSGWIVRFEIPEDDTILESHWENMFAKYDFLEWVEFSHNRYTLADGTINEGYEPGVTAIDSKIHIVMTEEYKTSPRTLQLWCMTERQYGSGGNPIVYAKQQSGGTIDISFKGVSETGMTDDIGPARAYIDLGSLDPGTYTLNLYNGSVKQTATLTVTAESYKVEMADNPTFGFGDRLLNRIPQNTIWGYVSYNSDTTPTIADSFLEDLAALGAESEGFAPGRYRDFVFRYDGALDKIESLILQYLSGSEKDNLYISVYTEKGEEILSWMIHPR